MAENSTNFKAVILAGGSGERFWPLSTPEHPKQFLNVFGGESLIRQSVSRLAGLVASENVFVITSAALVERTREELPEIPAANIVGEPMRRDTGAAVALGTGVAGEGVIGFFASDQLVSDAAGFRETLRLAVAKAEEGRAIVTLGIKPTFPATGFGYVDPATGKFVEKPDEAKAREYLQKGYLWNAGMFIAKAETFRGAFAAHAPALVPLATGAVKAGAGATGAMDAGATGAGAVDAGAGATGAGATGAGAELAAVYENLPRISFDYAVMEKYDEVAVVPGDFGWDDVGSYAAFDKYFPRDASGNVREGECVAVDASGNICVARAAKVALLGVKDLVVVTTKDAVLVADKAHLSDMKKLFVKQQ